MKKTIAAAGMTVLMAATSAVFGDPAIAKFRPPAVPLVACDPYFSVWSMENELTAGPTRHWTGKTHRFTSIVRIDGKAYRVMGDSPDDLPAATQTGLSVLPTRSVYTFEEAGVRLTLTFMTPLVPDDLMLMSRPITYVTWSATSTSGEHDVSVYLDAAAELATNTPEQPVVTSSGNAGALKTLRVGTVEQPVLGSRGDDHRIDWGYFTLAGNAADARILMRDVARGAFAKGEALPESAKADGEPTAENAPALAMAFPLGKVAAEAKTARAMLAYDDGVGIRYFNEDLKGYWTKDGTTFDQLLGKAEAEFDAIDKKAKAFDEELVADMKKIGGDGYAQIGVLAWRQSLAAQKIVADANGMPLSFSKENDSNGCMGTVDVLYPASPLMMAFSPNLLKASLEPLLAYSSSERWKHDSAPHDIGTYPLALGQVYGGGDSDSGMPVEETGNMLCMLAALAKAEGNAKFSEPYWPTLTKWADYLEKNGFDPGNQLTTDDFAGHIARNTNLSAKAIMGVASYAMLAEMLGKTDEAAARTKVAKAAADEWTTKAADGDHYGLVFGDKKAGTWSQKYNLVWDKLLGFNLFADEVTQKEFAFYKTKMNKYGLPLDSRKSYTKLDWELWTATMAPKPEDAQAIIDASARYVNETSTRVPLSDWYDTVSGRRSGFKARSVVGGVFIPFLKDPAMWKKYSSRDKTALKDWAEVDFTKPQVKVVVGTAENGEAATWHYSTSKPAGKWTEAGFDVGSWKTGKAGFGVRGTPGEKSATRWNTDDIYLRRDFDLPSGVDLKNLRLYVHHDDQAEAYLNGVPAARLGGFTGEYAPFRISDAALATLKPGKNTLAIHCHQDGGGQYVDAGLVEVIAKKK